MMLTTLWLLFLTLLSRPRNYSFLYLMGQKIRLRSLLLIFNLAFNFIYNHSSWFIIKFWGEDIYYLLLSFLLSTKTKNIKNKDFQWSFLISSTTLFKIDYFLYLPFFNISITDYQSSLLISIPSSIAPFVYHFFIKLFKGSFTILQKQKSNSPIQHIIIVANFFMFGYTLLLQILMYLENTTHSSTLELRKLCVVISLVLFFIMIVFLDRNIREMIQGQLDFQKNLQLENLYTYNKHIEGLYNSVRSFRHDYSNLLVTLRLGIDKDDMDIVKEAYDSVLQESDKRLNTRNFDLARLVNIQDNTLKSLLSAKVLQAEEEGIEAQISIPEPIHLIGMETLDFIIVTSIFLDNAIEGAIQTQNPKITISFWEDHCSQLLSISNTISEEKTETKTIFERGVSNKGRERGIGLANVTEILDNYINVNLETQSNNFSFTQQLTITKKA
ncbi:MAG: GHKL domain-containing protein [Streptococcus thermophilus]